MRHLLGEVRKLLGLLRLLRGQDYLRVVGKLSTPFRLQPQHQKRLIEEEMMGVGVKNLYCLFVGMLYQVLQLLMGQVSSQIRQLGLVLL